LLRASIGQIHYFRDLEVTLPGQSEINDNNSNIAGELAFSPNEHWGAISSVLWDTQDDEFNETNIRAQFKSSGNFIINVGHRFRREDFNQSDISMVLPLSPQWRAVTRWNYDLKENRNLEILGGLEYDTCCWKFRVVARRFNQDEDENYNNSIELQLTLKGLTSIGVPLDQYLERTIRGYENHNTFQY
ncbi:MAG: LPS assembly protein LptD, partial [Planctomycetaceae bacterium]|nr:LPS assembly protein LptD [Planctomycetaceae bacterium]